MKQSFFYIILFLFLLSPGCSSKQETNKSASVKSSDNGTEKTQLQNNAKDEITITTSDDVKLSADYYYISGTKETQQPLVVLIHQFNQNKKQWAEGFIDSLVSSGYKVLAYDIRGHGESDKVSYDLTELLVDPDKAPKDIEAVFNWAKAQKGVDTSNIAAIGTSIGGNLACYAKYYLGAKTIISVSSSAEGFYKFMGIDPRMMGRVFTRISHVLFITGKRDGDHEKDANEIMYDYVMDPKELDVIDSDKHGIFLIREHTEINSLIYGWLKKYL
jgi:esterase/lipase